MILSGHQPVYLPSILLFSKIAHSDIFMFVGHCQASPGTWHNRNKIRNINGGDINLVIPIKHDFGQSINETEFAGDNWKRKHLRSIELTYSRRPYFEKYFPALKECLEIKWDTLGPMCMALIELMCIWFGIETEILDSREYAIEGHKTDMLISMCEQVFADQYLSNEGSRDYVNEAQMARAGIHHRWLKFTHPTYDQGYPDFVTNLSAIDLLFNCGPASGQIIREAAHVD